MVVINQHQAVWSGVAGSPYYSSVFQLDGAGGTAQEFSTAWATFCHSLVGTMVNELTVTINTDVPQIESTTGELVGAVSVDFATFTGTQETDALPPSTQGLLRWGTGAVIGGRRLRGRMFIPGAEEANNLPVGRPTGTYVAAINTFANTFRTTVGSEFVIYSRTHRQVAVVTSHNCWNQWAVLRSRRD